MRDERRNCSVKNHLEIDDMVKVLLKGISEAIENQEVCDFVDGCWELWQRCGEKQEVFLSALSYKERFGTNIFEDAVSMRDVIVWRHTFGYEERAAIAEIFIWVLDQLGARETRFPISEKTLTAVRLRARETFVELNLPDEIYKKHSELVNGGAKVLGAPVSLPPSAHAFFGQGQGKDGVVSKSLRGRMASTPVGKEAEEMKKAQQADENEPIDSASTKKKSGCTIC